MIALALVLVFAGAGMHAAWNVLLKGSSDPLRVSQRALVVGTGLFAVPVLALWAATGRPGLSPAGWACVGVSALAEVLYFGFLSRAYRHGELSFVYPIARGSGSLLAVGLGLVALGERLSPLQLLGVAALLAGIWAVRRPSGSGPLGAALATGACIACYIVVDRIGVRQGPPWLFGWMVFALCAVMLTAWLRWRPSALPVPAWRTSLAVGSLMTTVYYLVLFALAIAPVAVVAPARESAIVLVSAWGVLRLREREGLTLKLAGAAAILAGVVLLVV